MREVRGEKNFGEPCGDSLRESLRAEKFLAESGQNQQSQSIKAIGLSEYGGSWWVDGLAYETADLVGTLIGWDIE